MFHEPYDEGMAETGPARKNRENRARNAEAAAMSFVREINCADHPRIYILSDIAPPTRAQSVLQERQSRDGDRG